MKSLRHYLVKPEQRYNNTKTFGDVEIFVNSSIGIEDHIYVNKVGTVLATPELFPSNVEVGDEVLVHHNTFRRWYDVRGREKNSGAYFEEDKYLVYPDQVYAVNKGDGWMALDGQCFIKPIEYTEFTWDTSTVQRMKGEIVMDSPELTEAGIYKGDVVGFSPEKNIEFQVNGERIFRTEIKYITVLYEPRTKTEETVGST